VALSHSVYASWPASDAITGTGRTASASAAPFACPAAIIDVSGTYTLTIEADCSMRCATRGTPQSHLPGDYRERVPMWFTVTIVGGGLQKPVAIGQLWVSGPTPWRYPIRRSRCSTVRTRDAATPIKTVNTDWESWRRHFYRPRIKGRLQVFHADSSLTGQQDIAVQPEQ
jgi:hypothetical protein